MWIKADKWRNIYKISPSNYHKILLDKITNTYKLDNNNNTILLINRDIANFANEFCTADRIGKIYKKKCILNIE